METLIRQPGLKTMFDQLLMLTKEGIEGVEERATVDSYNNVSDSAPFLDA
jgi:hypothetical protein